MKGEIPLPESIIQHIQSLMSGKEAARTTVLSKPWYNAWLTHPTLDLDDGDFHKSDGGEWWHAFEEFAEKTLRRYLESGLKIERFRLRTMHSDSALSNIVPVSIIIAMEIGATDVVLQLPWMATFPLSHVLGSETLLRLSLIHCHIEGNYAISCSMLKSLKLQNVSFENADDVFNDIISCCINSIEELSLSYCSGLALSSTNLSELHKLRHLFLDHMEVDAMFFNGFATRFPCLKDLSTVECNGYTRVVIASNSLETIRFEPVDDGPKRGTFDVPNIRKFTYSGGSILPSLSVNGASREWEFDMSIACSRIYNTYWFMNLKRLLAKFRLSRIFLSISLGCGKSVHGVGIKAVPKPLTVESLMIDVSSSCCGLLLSAIGMAPLIFFARD